MTDEAPVMLVATITKGMEGSFEVALEDLPAAAFEAVAPGTHHVFVGDGQVAIVWERATAEVPARLAVDEDARSLVDVLTAYTNFNPRLPDRFVEADLHHLGMLGGSGRGPWEGDM